MEGSNVDWKSTTSKGVGKKWLGRAPKLCPKDGKSFLDDKLDKLVNMNKRIASELCCSTSRSKLSSLFFLLEIIVLTIDVVVPSVKMVS
jgi:hypothetical protein